MLSASTPHSRLPVAPARVVGCILVTGAVLTLAAISHHPTLAAGEGDPLGQMVRLASMDRIVHGVVIAISAAFLFAMTVYSQRRGLDRQLVVGALIAYAIAMGTEIIAASIDGFLLPAIAEHAVRATPPAWAAALDVLSVCALTIQIATKIGLAATAIAFALWSFELAPNRGALRIAGILGLVVSVASCVPAFLTGNLNPHSLLAVIALQNAWYVTMGVFLIAGRV